MKSICLFLCLFLGLASSPVFAKEYGFGFSLGVGWSKAGINTVESLSADEKLHFLLPTFELRKYLPYGFIEIQLPIGDLVSIPITMKYEQTWAPIWFGIHYSIPTFSSMFPVSFGIEPFFAYLNRLEGKRYGVGSKITFRFSWEHEIIPEKVSFLFRLKPFLELGYQTGHRIENSFLVGGGFLAELTFFFFIGKKKEESFE